MHYDTRDAVKSAKDSNWFELARQDKETNGQIGGKPYRSRVAFQENTVKQKLTYGGHVMKGSRDPNVQWLLVLRLMGRKEEIDPK